MRVGKSMVLDNHHRRCGVTLVELAVVLAAGVLLLGMIAPALHAARRFSYDEVCLNNLREFGGAIHTYAAGYDGRLPGPLHPAIYQNQRMETYLDLDYSEAQAYLWLERQAVWLLSSVLGDAVNDRTATCPVLAGVVNDAHRRAFWETHPGQHVFPTHYALNNYYTWDPSVDSPGAEARFTSPGSYFGYSPPPGSTFSYAPRRWAEIPRAADEWMVADAWFRDASTGNSPILRLYQQDGTYQSVWSGEAMSYSAPHGRPALRIPADSMERQLAAAAQRNAQQDGWTNTVFIDGHAAGVPSRRLRYQSQTIMYGFPGTVNPDLRGLSDSDIAIVNQLRWE